MKIPADHLPRHQYIERESGRVFTERPFGDRIVNWLYAAAREEAFVLYRLLGSRRLSALLGWASYDFPLGTKLCGMRRFLSTSNVDLDECIEPAELDSARKIFERQIRYWQCRPMATDSRAVVCPADARLLIGSLETTSSLFLKGKFFDYEELLGSDKGRWLEAFRAGDFVVCRLTPDKYHYNHTPVAGVVLDIYENGGTYHSCNPGPVITLATPYSKNQRVVTILDSDCAGGTGVGLVAMIEVVALMIGEVVQCYSEVAYREPAPVTAGMKLEKGRPKSLYRPGSSTTVLLFQRGRVEFAADLIRNLRRSDVVSRFSQGFGRSLVETDVKVRAAIGAKKI